MSDGTNTDLNDPVTVEEGTANLTAYEDGGSLIVRWKSSMT